jgi:hypothetical protein
MEHMEDDLDVDNLLESDAEYAALERRKSGRPQDIDAATLRYRRDHFVALFEDFWCEIGFRLQMATTIAEIKGAFAPIPVHTHGEVKIFVIETSDAMCAPELRKTRAEIRTIVDSKHSTENQLTEERAMLQQARSALETTDGSARFQVVRHEYVRREIQLAERVSELVRLILCEKKLRQKLDVGEVSFAQRELLNFILSQRHSLEPLNFANAAAGLPQIGWRQSFKRCKEMAYEEEEAMRYRIFKALRRALAYRKSRELELLEGVRSWLKKSSRSTDTATSELKKNWYYLQRALDSMARSPSIRKSCRSDLPQNICEWYSVLPLPTGSSRRMRP